MNVQFQLDQEHVMTVKMYRESGNREPRVHRRGIVPAAVILMILATGLGMASQIVPPLPKAESILDAFVEKAGGRAAFDKISNRRATAVLKMALMPAPGEVTSTVTKAGPYRSVVETQGHRPHRIRFRRPGRLGDQSGFRSENPGGGRGPAIPVLVRPGSPDALARDSLRRSSAWGSSPWPISRPSRSWPCPATTTPSPTISTRPRGFWSRSSIPWRL